MINICYICTGNTCRSIMAERLMKKLLKDNGIKDVKVSSKGVCAKKENITLQAKNTLKKLKASSGDRKSIKLGKVKKDVLYIVMTENLKNYVNADKVITIKQLLGYDIQDPYGQDEDVYMQVAQDLIKANQVILKKILMWRK